MSAKIQGKHQITAAALAGISERSGRGAQDHHQDPAEKNKHPWPQERPQVKGAGKFTRMRATASIRVLVFSS